MKRILILIVLVSYTLISQDNLNPRKLSLDDDYILQYEYTFSSTVGLYTKNTVDKNWNKNNFILGLA